MSCDDKRFSATIVLPRSFVSTPQFNNLIDDSHSLSFCSITQLKYRLYPTFTLLANPWRNCGAFELNVTASGDDKRNEYNDNINSMSNTDALNKNHDRQQQVTKASYHKILAITIRFPMIEKLRTIEDKYATLICSYLETANINEKNLNLPNEAEVKFKDAISIVDKTLKWSRRSGPSEWWTTTPLTTTTQTTKFTDNANESRNSNLLIKPIKDIGSNRNSEKLKDAKDLRNNKTIIITQLRYPKLRVYNEPIKLTIGSSPSTDKRNDGEEVVDGIINNEENTNDDVYDDDNEAFNIATYTRDKDDNLSKEFIDRPLEQSKDTNNDNDDNGDYSLEDKQPLSVLHANGSLVSDLSSWLASRRRKECESSIEENYSKNTNTTTSPMNNDDHTQESANKYNKTNLHENHWSNNKIKIERQSTNNNNINSTMLTESTSLVPLFVSSDFEHQRSTTTSRPTTVVVTTNMTSTVVVDEFKNLYKNPKLHLIDSSFGNLASKSEESLKLKVNKTSTKVGSSLNDTSTSEQELDSVDNKLKLIHQKQQQQQRYHQTTTSRHLSPTFGISGSSVLLSVCLIGAISIALILLAFSVLLANLAS